VLRAACKVAVLVLAGCAGRGHVVVSAEPAAVAALPCAASADPRCEHPISRIVIDDLARRGLPAPLPEPDELCRRLAVDVLGHIPTAQQRRECLEQPYESTVDAWLRSAEHTRLGRRTWAELTGFPLGWEIHLRDFDRLVTAEAAAELRYDTFAARVVLHPAFYHRHPREDWIRAIFEVFLGRPARQDEVTGLAELLPIWSTGVPTNRRVVHRELGFDVCACKWAAANCVSDTLGRRVDFRGPPCIVWQPRLVRLIEASVDPTRTGSTTDRSGAAVDPLPLADPATRERLQTLGDAITARSDFWERAVDRELRRLLGWWQSTFVVADSDVPRVRDRLVEDLRRHGIRRELERTILTSILYTMPALGGAGTIEADAVPWASGPRKAMPGLVWLDSAQLALDTRFRVCGTRRGLAYWYEGEEDPRRRYGLAQFEATCGITTEPTPASLDAQISLSALLCARGVQRRWGRAARSPTREEAAADLVTSLLGREPRSGEVAALAADMHACEADANGCSSEPDAIRWTCMRILQSTAFATY
jgi:hypothetical protein